MTYEEVGKHTHTSYVAADGGEKTQDKKRSRRNACYTQRGVIQQRPEAKHEMSGNPKRAVRSLKRAPHICKKLHNVN